MSRRLSRNNNPVGLPTLYEILFPRLLMSTIRPTCSSLIRAVWFAGNGLPRSILPRKRLSAAFYFLGGRLRDRP